MPALEKGKSASRLHRGIDCSETLIQPKIDLLLKTENPPSFIARYYGFDLAGGKDRGEPLSKCVTPTEAQLISKNGLKLVVVYQWRANRLSEFKADPATGLEAGTRDATIALQYARGTMRQPKGSGIYFAVDLNVQKKDLDTISHYFSCVRGAFALQEDFYRVGVYGSGLVCSALAANHLADLTWLAQSTGWLGYRAYSESGAWKIRQGPTRKTSAKGVELEFDENEANESYGEFHV